MLSWCSNLGQSHLRFKSSDSISRIFGLDTLRVCWRFVRGNGNEHAKAKEKSKGRVTTMLGSMAP